LNAKKPRTGWPLITRMRPTARLVALPLACLLALGGLFAAWAPEASGVVAPPGPTTNPKAVYRFAGGTYDDVTGPATNDAENDVALDKNVDTALYFGYDKPFDQMLVRVGTGRDGGGVVWEYSNGAMWSELVPSDPSLGLSEPGTYTVSWNPPRGWGPVELDASQAPGANFYVRLRVTQRLDGAARISKASLEVWDRPAAVWAYAAQAWGPPPALTASDILGIAAKPGVALAVADDGTVLRSTDGGDRWARVATLNGSPRGIDLIDSTHGIAVGAAGAIWRTSDGGLSWSRLGIGTQAVLEAVQWVTSSLIVVVGDGVVYHSRDAGSTWTKDPPSKHYFDVSFSDPLHGWVVGDEINRESVWKTSDGGETWTEVDIALPNIKFAKGVQFWDDKYGWIVGDKFRVRTRDGGENWEYWNIGSNMKDIVLVDPDNGWIVGDQIIERIHRGREEGPLVTFDSQYHGFGYAKRVANRSASTVLAVGSSGLLLRTNNGGETWMQPGVRPTTDIRNLERLDSGTIWAAGAAGTLLRSLDGGRNWTGFPADSADNFYDVDFVDDQHGWAVGDKGLIRATSDGGYKWTDQSSGSVGTFYALAMASTTTGIIVGDLGKAYRTTNGGDTWTPVDAPNPIPLRDVARAGAHTFAVGGANVYRLDDGSASWATIPVDQATELRAVHFADDHAGWLADASGKVFQSLNSGASWTRQYVSPTVPVYGVYAASADVVWAVGEGGHLWRTNNGGDTWNDYETGTTNALYAVAARPEGPAAAGGSLGVLRSTDPKWVDVTGLLGGANPGDIRQATSASSGDALYFAQADPFDSLLIKATAARKASVVWEYPSATGWKALSALDGTQNMECSGICQVKFPLPTDWTPLRIANETSDRSWIRMRFLAPPANGLAYLVDAWTLRLQQGLQNNPTVTSSATSAASSTPITAFAMSANPTAIDFGRLERGAHANATLQLLAYRGSASATVRLEGTAAAWLDASASQFELKQDVEQALRLDLVVPAEADPGPAHARLYVDARPFGTFSTVVGWVDIDLVIDAADLTHVAYLLDPPRWTAHFLNYAPNATHVRFEATLKGLHSPPLTLPAQEVDVDPDSDESVEGPIDPGLAPGAYDLRVTARFGENAHSRELRIFLGASPVTIDGFSIDTKPLKNVTFEFTMHNEAPVPVTARPVVVVTDVEGNEVARVAGQPLPIEANASRQVVIEWEPVFGVFQASAHAEVENAPHSAPLEQSFVVRGVQRHSSTFFEQYGLFVLVAFVLLANVAAGLGLWTGNKRA